MVSFRFYNEAEMTSSWIICVLVFFWLYSSFITNNQEYWTDQRTSEARNNNVHLSLNLTRAELMSYYRIASTSIEAPNHEIIWSGRRSAEKRATNSRTALSWLIESLAEHVELATPAKGAAWLPAADTMRSWRKPRRCPADRMSSIQMNSNTRMLWKA